MQGDSGSYIESIKNPRLLQSGVLFCGGCEINRSTTAPKPAIPVFV